jgi:hypothetical protein
MLLRNMPEPSNPEAHRARDEIRGLLETAAVTPPGVWLAFVHLHGST